MSKLFSFSLFLLFFSLFSLSTLFAVETLTCTYREGDCLVNESAVLFPSDTINAHVNTFTREPYNYSVCCASPFTELDFSVHNGADTCSSGGFDMLYFTSATNSRVAIDFTPAHHPFKVCSNILDDRFSTFDVVASESDAFGDSGYTCLFKASGRTGAKISACNATFGPSEEDTYSFTFWGRLFESFASLQCTEQCTSKLDNRVYRACRDKIPSCDDVPVECNGSVLGAWVSINETTELQCSAPWDKTREKRFSEDAILIDSNNERCPNVIVRKFPVLLESEPVSLNVYICGGSR